MKKSVKLSNENLESIEFYIEDGIAVIIINGGDSIGLEDDSEIDAIIEQLNLLKKQLK